MIRTQKALSDLKNAWAAIKSRWPASIGKTALCLVMSSVCGLGALAITAGEPAVASAPSPTAVSPQADSKTHQAMTYQVYAGGINAMTAELTVTETESDNYILFLEAATKGLLGKLAPWRGSFETKGLWDDDGTGIPRLHRSVAVWQDEKETKEYIYDDNRTLTELKIIEDGKDKSPRDLNKDLAAGTIDALTATLAAMKQTVTDNDCTGESEVFDGKRRFKLVFSKQDIGPISASKYNVYDGEAVECAVEVVPMGGRWHDKPRGWLSIQEQGRKKGTLPTVWLAQIDDTAPAVPVKIRVKTNYGTLFMHLTDYKSDNIQLSAR